MYLAIFDWILLFDLSVIIQLKYLIHLKQKKITFKEHKRKKHYDGLKIYSIYPAKIR